MGPGPRPVSFLMPRPALTRSRAVSVGISIVNELGLRALTPEALARRVRSSPTSVQRVITHNELVEAVAIELTASMPGVAMGSNRTKRLRHWAVDTRDWLAEYPGLASYLMANRWDIPSVLDRMEAVVAVLDAPDLDGDHGLMAGLTLFWFVLGSAEGAESTRVLGGEFSNRRTDAATKNWPRLATHINDYSSAFADSQFTFALEILLQGLTQSPTPGDTRVKS
jgi:Tetracyclin repressor-like, C-terminal domain